jgi:hypothetical protein
LLVAKTLPAALFPNPTSADNVTLVTAAFVLLPKFESNVWLLPTATFVKLPAPGATLTTA